MAGRWRNDWLPACCAAACRCNTVINTSLAGRRALYCLQRGTKGQIDACRGYDARVDSAIVPERHVDGDEEASERVSACVRAGRRPPVRCASQPDRRTDQHSS